MFFYFSKKRKYYYYAVFRFKKNNKSKSKFTDSADAEIETIPKGVAVKRLEARSVKACVMHFAFGNKRPIQRDTNVICASSAEYKACQEFCDQPYSDICATCE